MMEWMGQQIKSCQQPPIGRQTWVKKKEDIHPMRGNGWTKEDKVFMPMIWFLILGIRFDCMNFYVSYLILVVQSWNLSYLPPISLERILQVLSGEDRKSRSGDCFSVLATSSLHRFDRALYACCKMLLPYSMFNIYIYIYIYKIWVENAGNFILFSWHVR
jgi:hypothetical protein